MPPPIQSNKLLWVSQYSIDHTRKWIKKCKQDSSSTNPFVCNEIIVWKIEAANWMNGTCQGSIFARQKYKSNVKLVGEKPLTKTAGEKLWREKWKNASQLIECEIERTSSDDWNLIR